MEFKATRAGFGNLYSKFNEISILEFVLLEICQTIVTFVYLLKEKKGEELKQVHLRKHILAHPCTPIHHRIH